MCRIVLGTSAVYFLVVSACIAAMSLFDMVPANSALCRSLALVLTLPWTLFAGDLEDPTNDLLNLVLIVIGAALNTIILLRTAHHLSLPPLLRRWR